MPDDRKFRVKNIRTMMLVMDLDGGGSLILRPGEISRELTEVEKESPQVQKHVSYKRAEILKQ